MPRYYDSTMNTLCFPRGDASIWHPCDSFPAPYDAIIVCKMEESERRLGGIIVRSNTWYFILAARITRKYKCLSLSILRSLICCWVLNCLLLCVQIAVPQPLVGHIIGKGGTFVREVLAVTAVQVRPCCTFPPQQSCVFPVARQRYPAVNVGIVPQRQYHVFPAAK